MTVTLDWRGAFATQATRRAAAAGLRDAAEMIEAASNAAAPSESGHLIDSSGVDVDVQGLAASVYYDPQGAPRGGKDIYAVVRHEALRQGGAPKYLERPLIAKRHEALRLIAGQIQKVL